MGYPLNDGGTFLLDVDASGLGIGGVLSQEQEGRERVISYASRAMNRAERKYRPGTKQAHCDALSRCESPRDCSCDQVDMSEPLKCGPCSKCQRRAEIMLASWKPPILEERADVRSGEKSSDDSTPGNISRVVTRAKAWMGTYSPQEMARLQNSDPCIGPVKSLFKEQRRPSRDDTAYWSPEARHYVLMWEQLHLDDDVLYLKCPFNGVSVKRLVVPTQLRTNLIGQMHDTVVGGHQGITRTKANITKLHYWYDLKTDVKLYVQQCDVCEANKKPQRLPRAPMGHLKSGAPWDLLCMDFLGPLSVTSRGIRFILVMSDYFTKYVEVIPVADQTAETCANAVIEHFIAR
ncbi:uncharacterized protein LOC127852543 [Dreissena polymorpha]|uniref:uncharacterized protein LOC127852543 n=1 Tax=Dreissena polymorpha TaxID=45954 RepID=UPI002264275E|nr:uncharacterized protein LOC127852543 [Dreissena polymorpha]